LIKAIVAAINEGNTNDFNNSKILQQIYGEEIADNYQKMMKSLNTIKTLKNEIENFMQGSVNNSQNDSDILMKINDSNDSSGHQSGCFSCI